MRVSRFLLRLFLISAGVNFVWEMAQMPLYQDMPFDELSSWLLCLRASLGDGVIILIIWGVGAALYRSVFWFSSLSVGRVALLLVAGLLIAASIELHALALDRWAYSALMPIVPVAGVGFSPSLQLVLLPWPSMKAAVNLHPRS